MPNLGTSMVNGFFNYFTPPIFIFCNYSLSICKLCSKQCRGFRGLVDHMHRDHQDYKPWSCHLCNEKTTFVKTLYRHLKKEHASPGSNCPVCGKFYSRAQSMLQHFQQQVLPSERRGQFLSCQFQHETNDNLENYQRPAEVSQDDENSLFMLIETL